MQLAVLFALAADQDSSTQGMLSATQAILRAWAWAWACAWASAKTALRTGLVSCGYPAIKRFAAFTEDPKRPLLRG